MRTSWFLVVFLIKYLNIIMKIMEVIYGIYDTVKGGVNINIFRLDSYNVKIIALNMTTIFIFDYYIRFFSLKI